ncbi:MAG: Ig-like domain-containing protein [Clostridia bacterium]|nr:Ig-like domain-containing protein [Clostridia bacterium]
MNGKLKQFVAFGVASVVALAVCLGVLVVTVNNLGDETTTTENKAIINKTEFSSSKKELADYVNTLISETDSRFVKTKAYTEISVNDLKVLNSENQAQDEALLNFAKDKMLSSVDDFYDGDFQGTFEKGDSKKPSFIVDEAILKDAGFSIGQVNENGESLYDDEGNLIDNEYYFLTYSLDVKSELFNKKYSEKLSLKNDLSAKRQFVDAVKDNCKINSFDAKLESLLIEAKVNRENDYIQYIDVIRQYAVALDTEFINDAELFGEKEISFVYTVTDTYEYSYAGISFVEDEVTIKQGEEYMLNVNAIIDDDSEYTVEFSSSNDDIATIDEMGYVKGLKNIEEPAIITVKLSYLEEAFTDTCIVNVSEE